MGTCLLLFACSLLLMISLQGQADHKSSWPFPVPEAIAIGKLNLLLGGGDFSITAQQVADISSRLTVVIALSSPDLMGDEYNDGVTYWAGVAEAIKTESGSSTSISAAEVKK